MTTKMISILITALVLSLTSRSQQTELFAGETLLNDCKVDIPLTYDKKDKAEYEKAALDYKDVRLVLLHCDKKTKKVSYSTYYIVVDNTTDQTFVYLETPENHNSNTKKALFIPFNLKYDRFYREECFDKIIIVNPTLKESFQPK